MNPSIKEGGSNYHSERLLVRGNLIVVKPTKRHLFCMSLFGIVGLFFVVFPCLLEQRIIWPGVIFGGVFFLLGCSIFIGELLRPRPLINLSLRQLYPKGMKHPELAVPLNSFRQLEIVAKSVHNPKGKGFPCYELNVVLNDDSRHNILNHGSEKALLEEARMLAELLNLPLIGAEPLTPEQISPGFTIFGLIICLGCLAAGFSALWICCIKPLSKWNESRQWLSTPAVIVYSDLDKDHSDTHLARIDVRYDYEVDGHLYHGKQYDFFRSDNYAGQNSSLWQVVTDNPVGKKTTYLVNPANPEESVLTRAIPRSQFFVFLFPIPFIFLGIFFAIMILKPIFSRK